MTRVSVTHALIAGLVLITSRLIVILQFLEYVSRECKKLQNGIDI